MNSMPNNDCFIFWELVFSTPVRILLVVLAIFVSLHVFSVYRRDADISEERAQERRTFGSWVVITRDSTGNPNSCRFVMVRYLTQRPGYASWTDDDGSTHTVVGNVSVGAYTRFEDNLMISQDIDRVFWDLGMDPNTWFSRCEDSPMDNWQRIQD